MAKKIVHYINQFYAGIGGEEQALIGISKQNGVVGPGLAFERELKKDFEIVGTVICGDSFFNENLESAKTEVLEAIKSYNPDMVIAGPAFNAGRYGMACGEVAKMCMKAGIIAVTGMYEENPGVDSYQKDAYIVKVGNSAATMRKAVPKMAALINKLANCEEVDPDADEYYVRNRRNFFMEDRGSKRAVDMLVAKLNGEEFKTEFIDVGDDFGSL